MEKTEVIICKPTPWFTLRAVAILAMFSVFAVLFYIDGTTGYRKKNLTYYLHKSFKPAVEQFAQMDKESPLTAAQWKEYAEAQEVEIPDNLEVLPKDTERPLKWPEVLSDFEQVKDLQPQILWKNYSGENGLSEKPPEQAYTEREIREQIIFFYVCSALSAIALFFLIRTTQRTIAADQEQLYTAAGATIPYRDMTTLDLRKWDTKGIAFITSESEGKTKRSKIDGLTYGGFKVDKGEFAEKLMQRICQNFSGEIIEFTKFEETEKTKAS